jgi:YesN/AraC family two-component response regulator
MDTSNPATVMFVDDDPSVLSGLERTLRPWRDDFNMVFICGAPAALVYSGIRAVDVVVTDMVMPLLDGKQLIGRLRERNPDTAFIVLSGRCDGDLVESLTDDDVVFVAKPTSAATLQVLINDAIDSLMVRKVQAGEYADRQA